MLNDLQEKDEKREKLVQDRKKAMLDDIETRKEISLLKQLDVKDNQKRGHLFHNMYKKSLADKIVEKKEKAALVREQQARIAQTCRTQRVSYEKAFALVNEE